MAFATCATSRSSGERSLHTGFAELSCPDRLKGAVSSAGERSLPWTKCGGPLRPSDGPRFCDRGSGKRSPNARGRECMPTSSECSARESKNSRLNGSSFANTGMALPWRRQRRRLASIPSRPVRRVVRPRRPSSKPRQNAELQMVR